jgi:hypothetical protein
LKYELLIAFNGVVPKQNELVNANFNGH